ncbi:hypothetical protein DPV79_16210 [Burkholderia reimsis]|uniref:Uncharacterized protein n=1 Tax=Burkholderia reimsis TaxID=2234132 RepID=A0A365QUX1_9BURK|nr:hypothetical protein DPV79_16210 [Burkholderia reimsis]
MLIVGLAISTAVATIAQQLYQGDLLTRAGLQQRLYLKVLTYHYMNRGDQYFSVDTLLAERGFVYFLAALCIGALGASICLESRMLRRYMIAYIAITSIFMFGIFVLAQYNATYALG